MRIISYWSKRFLSSSCFFSLSILFYLCRVCGFQLIYFIHLICIQGSPVVCENILRGNVQHLKRLLRLNHLNLARIKELEFFDAHFIECEMVSKLTTGFVSTSTWSTLQIFNNARLNGANM